MCSRYGLIAAADRLQQRFDQKALEELIFKPEIRIGDLAPIVTREGLRLGKFGLTGHNKRPVFNARSETWEQKKLFLELEPCLIPATSFWEWSPAKRIFEFGPELDEFLVFPGLFGKGAFAILTCDPDDIVGPIHDRMPLCLPRDTETDWLARVLPKSTSRLRVVAGQSSLF